MVKFFFNNDKNLIIYSNEIYSYYTILHIKLSTLFYSTQLVDAFAYELPINQNTANFSPKDNVLIPINNNSILVYNFHSILNHQRFFIFLLNTEKTKNTKKSSIKSIAELFPNANWLEREIAELHGIFFSGKKDTRNLMLQYGDTSAPMKKSFPSIGLREIFYDSVTDTLVQNPVSVQF